MFTSIAPRYDLLNHLLSFNVDRLWRRTTAKTFAHILRRPHSQVLDLCCGTGDLSLALRRQAARADAKIIGADFSHAMLQRAAVKAVGPTLRWIEADALSLPFPESSFDLVTCAFGFRNLANYEAGLREILRVLKPGGIIAILEFTEPPEGLLGDFYRWYFCKVLPKIGGLISGDQAAYKYLPKSVARFFRPPELAALMDAVGYKSVDYRAWTLGTVALHTAVRPG